MTKITYCITEEELMLGKCKQKTYGVAAYVDDNGCESITEVASVKNITSNKPKILEFVQLCNDEKLSTIHLPDAVEDFFSE